MKGTFFGSGGDCWGGEKGWSLQREEEEKREEDMWGIKKKERDKVEPLNLIEHLVFRREARAMELGESEHRV